MGGRCRRLGWPSCCRRGPPSCRYLQGPVRGSAVATPVNGDSDVARDLPASFKTMLQVAYSVFVERPARKGAGGADLESG